MINAMKALSELLLMDVKRAKSGFPPDSTILLQYLTQPHIRVDLLAHTRITGGPAEQTSSVPILYIVRQLVVPF